MFGWEFPPFNSGGLGVACQGLVKGLASQGARISFVLPKRMNCYPDYCSFIFGDSGLKVKDKDDWKKIFGSNVKQNKVEVFLSPYLTEESYKENYSNYLSFLKGKGDGKKRLIYSPTLVGEVLRYAAKARAIAESESFDIIHCHDWLSFPAALEAKRVSGKPLVFHVHATEFDRVGKNCLNEDIYLIEKQGFEEADRIIAVSDYTKRKIVENYGVRASKISVVPNAVDASIYLSNDFQPMALKKQGKKIVLFVGRLTFQKGPDYFLRAAQKVLNIDPDVYFVLSGSGDMERQLIEESARMGISDKVIFAGFLRGDDLVRLYKAADLYVMPSVSEPFGLTSLESLASGTPILVSRQSGVSEMLSHCLKVDFWNVDQIADKILAVIGYPELKETLQMNGSNEVNKFSWIDSAKRCLSIYGEVLKA
ncbi:MAG: glycosyltransferase family 4 protein [Candidatus Paceibacterota bacterium]